MSQSCTPIKTAFAIALPLAMLAIGTGCPKEHFACTDDLRSSVVIHIFDDNGLEVNGALVTYSVDGSDESNCTSNETTNEHVCGSEESGDFKLFIDAEGYELHTEELNIGHDECHVITEELDVFLPLPSVE
ncbi:MAG: hypothetical protein HN348_12520 [Proteobacteria bacterium]|jgi:hypothetical protein|nr:hypothetical protein [Pseudomonadota bacterium]